MSRIHSRTYTANKTEELSEEKKAQIAKEAKEKGNLAFQNKDFELAVKNFTDAIENDPLQYVFYRYNLFVVLCVFWIFILFFCLLFYVLLFFVLLCENNPLKYVVFIFPVCMCVRIIFFWGGVMFLYWNVLILFNVIPTKYNIQ